MNAVAAATVALRKIISRWLPPIKPRIRGTFIKVPSNTNRLMVKHDIFRPMHARPRDADNGRYRNSSRVKNSKTLRSQPQNR